jgi:hypothetical protein
VGLVEDFAPVRYRLRAEDFVNYRRQLARILSEWFVLN